MPSAGTEASLPRLITTFPSNRIGAPGSSSDKEATCRVPRFSYSTAIRTVHMALYLSLLRLCPSQRPEDLVLPLLLVWLFERCQPPPPRSSHHMGSDAADFATRLDAIQSPAGFDVGDTELDFLRTPQGPSSGRHSDADDSDTPFLLSSDFKDSSDLLGWTLIDIAHKRTTSPDSSAM